MEYVIEQLKRIMAIPSPSGYTDRAANYIREELAGMGYGAWLTNKGGVMACLGGDGDPLIFSAHIDTLGAMVAEIKSNGKLRVVSVGGLNPYNTEAENCVVHCRLSGAQYEGTLQLNNASIHVNREYASTKREFKNMEVVLDAESDSAEAAAALGISVGDFVSFDPRIVVTDSGYIKSRFLDDKLSAAILLGYAKRIADGRAALKRKVYLYFTVYEEVGHGCAGAIPPDAVEIVSVDMGCVGDGLTCTERQVSICVADSHGPYNYAVTTALMRCAKERGIDYAADVYPMYGSDAEAALYAGHELRHGLIGPGVYASHGYERSHISGAKHTLELIEAYTLEQN
ncbi:MAG: M42 family metallopeptidase [Clostridia bacterium]|nr:M42 family metallopeptidase [Clostridia bacterium]